MSRASRLARPRTSAASLRRVDAVLGIGCLVLAVALIAVAVLVYNKTFVASTDVQLRAGAIGNALQKGSDVKLHGVPVGEVTRVRAVDDGAVLTLALDPDTAGRLPASTVARILPKTLFGERYVALVPPTSTSTAAGSAGTAGGAGTAGAGSGVATDAVLRAGDTIRQDTSHEAVELAEVFDQMLPLLRSIRPDQLAATMGELATTLRGRGADIGDSLARWAAYLKKLNPTVPTMTEDFAKLARVAQAYDDAAPDLLDALQTMTTTMTTFADQRTQLRDAFANVITSADTTHGWVRGNQDTIVVLSKRSRAALEAVRPYASQFPCLLKAARKFVPVMDHALGKGTKEPGMHVRLQVVAARGKYLAGKDKPVYLKNKAPRCPYVTGEVGTRPAPDARSAGQLGDEAAPAAAVDQAGTETSTGADAGTDAGSDPGSGADRAGDAQTPATIGPPPSAHLQQQLAGVRGLGEANSPAENQLIAELLAPTRGMAPADFPDWASLLAGPLLRNTKVSLR